MMDRRAFLCGLTGMVALPPVAEGQQAAKIPRIGVLVPDLGSVLPSPSANPLPDEGMR
jgi:hypothetical protein